MAGYLKLAPVIISVNDLFIGRTVLSGSVWKNGQYCIIFLVHLCDSWWFYNGCTLIAWVMDLSSTESLCDGWGGRWNGHTISRFFCHRFLAASVIANIEYTDFLAANWIKVLVSLILNGRRWCHSLNTAVLLRIQPEMVKIWKL